MKTAAIVLTACLLIGNSPGAPGPDLKPGQAASQDNSAAEPNEVLTLPAALARTLMNNPELSAYSWEVRSADARALQVGLRPNPELEITVEEAGGSGPRSGFNAAETTVQVNQLVERGGKRAKRVQAAAFEKELAALNYQSKRLDVLAQTTKAFHRVLAAQETLALSEQLLTLSAQQADAVRQRVEAGKDMPLEQNKAQVAYSQTQIQHGQAVRALEDARRQLSAAWGQNEPVFERTEGRLEDLGALPPFGQLAGRIWQNPDLARRQVEIERSKAQEELERAGGKSDLTVSAGMQRFNETDDNAIMFGVSIPLPVFNRNQGNLAAARYQTHKARQQKKAEELRIHAKLSRSYAELSSAHAAASETKTHILQNARQAYEHAAEAWRQGKVDYLNVLDAQRTFFETQTQYLETLAAFHTAQADVQRLTGTFNSDDPMKTQSEGQDHEQVNRTSR
ncbi:MAG: TolC family protein [Planctomycetaceae bacterium]|nr:TolC family protein [Planctomycetaceae bacterium]